MFLHFCLFSSMVLVDLITAALASSCLTAAFFSADLISSTPEGAVSGFFEPSAALGLPLPGPSAGSLAFAVSLTLASLAAFWPLATVAVSFASAAAASEFLASSSAFLTLSAAFAASSFYLASASALVLASAAATLAASVAALVS